MTATTLFGTNLNNQQDESIKLISTPFFYSLTLRSNVFCIPFAAPSTAGFVGISPKGRGMDAARQQVPTGHKRAGSPLC